MRSQRHRRRDASLRRWLPAAPAFVAVAALLAGAPALAHPVEAEAESAPLSSGSSPLATASDDAGEPAATAAGQAAPQGDQPQPTFKEALGRGQFRLAFRYRFENVEQEGMADEAHASTLRTTLRYQTLPFRGLSFLVEAEDTSDTNDLYNNAGAGSLGNGRSDRPVVADPDLTELNQAALLFARGGFDLWVGRSEVAIGNERFVGPVGWRQHHQSFDGVGFGYAPTAKLRLAYRYLENVHRIFGDRQELGGQSLVLDWTRSQRLALHAYALDLDYEELTALATRTFGARLTGKVGEGTTRLTYAAELATQEESARNPNRVDADYRHLELGAERERFRVAAGWESLGGEPGRGAFSTPLATLHKFNGWADKFLATPANGLDDLYLSLGGSYRAFGWAAVYHDFRAATGSERYGSELDLQLSYRTPWGQLFAVKAALYDADDFATDTDKLFFYTTYAVGN